MEASPPGWGPPDLPQRATTRERLEDGVVLPLAVDSTFTLTAVRNGAEARTFDIELPALAGTLEASASGGELAVDALSVDLGDLVVSAEDLPSSGLRLTGVSVSLAEPAAATGLWSLDDETGQVELEVAFVLDWAVVGPDGEAIPLAPQHIDGVAATFQVTREDGRLVATLDGALDGEFFDWSGLIELRDLGFQVSARESGSGE